MSEFELFAEAFSKANRQGVSFGEPRVPSRHDGGIQRSGEIPGNRSSGAPGGAAGACQHGQEGEAQTAERGVPVAGCAAWYYSDRLHGA